MQEAVSVSRGLEVPKQPKVSIIIPAYNTAPFIAETLDSVLAQTYPNFEAIVINDGSPDTDELERVIAPYRERIVYIKQSNKRAAGARNTGIRHAGGEYLAFLDSDDCLMPEALAVQLRKFEDDPSLDMVYADAMLFDDPVGLGKTCMELCPSTGPVTFESLVNEETQVCIVGTVIRKAMVLKVGPFDESLRRCDDYDMWLRVAYAGGKISYHRAVLGKARPGRPSSLGASELGMLEASMEILSGLDRKFQLSGEQRALIQRRIAFHQAHHDRVMAKQYLARREYESAVASLVKANSFFHSLKFRLALVALRTSPGLVRMLVIGRSSPA
jgi:glycosyltransferase involved in cell wall biosynthesis